MKKQGIIISVVSVVIALIMVVACLVISGYYHSKERAMNYWDSAYEYLYERYGKEAKFLNNGTYYDSAYFYTVYFDNEDETFQVRAFPSVSTFSDDYILRLLEWEISALIENVCHNYYTDVDCTTHIIHGIDDEEILERYYRNQQSLIHGIQADNKISVNINIYQDNNVLVQKNFSLILEELNDFDFTVDEIEFCLYNHKGKLQISQEYKKTNNNYQVIK